MRRKTTHSLCWISNNSQQRSQVRQELLSNFVLVRHFMVSDQQQGFVNRAFGYESAFIYFLIVVNSSHNNDNHTSAVR